MKLFLVKWGTGSSQEHCLSSSSSLTCRVALHRFWRTATCRNLKSSVQSSKGLFDPIFLWIYFSKLEPGAQWYCLSCLAHSYQHSALVMDSITVLLLFPQYLPAATARHSPTCLFMSLFHRHENKQNDSHSLTLRSQQRFGRWGASGVEGGLS